jgi:RNA polymerase sigma-54 factor
VEAEDKAHPLSDEALAARLKARGVTIARRTVVKYREQMGIQPARRRRKHGPGAGR